MSKNGSGSRKLQQGLSDGGSTTARSAKNPHVLTDSSSTEESEDAEVVTAGGSRKHRLAHSAGRSRNLQDTGSGGGSGNRRGAVAASGSRKCRHAVFGGGSGDRQDVVAATGSGKRRHAVSSGGSGNRQDAVFAGRSRKRY